MSDDNVIPLHGDDIPSPRQQAFMRAYLRLRERHPEQWLAYFRDELRRAKDHPTPGGAA